MRSGIINAGTIITTTRAKERLSQNMSKLPDYG